MGGIPAPAATTLTTAGGGTTTGQFATGGEHDWNVGPTTTTKDWGADEGGDWSNTDTNVITLFGLYIHLQFFILQVNW